MEDGGASMRLLGGESGGRGGVPDLAALYPVPERDP